jgi:hypothetical protein
MDRMAGWAVIIPAEQWATERLYHHDSVTVSASAVGARAVAADDEVLLVADGAVVALARAAKALGDRVPADNAAADRAADADRASAAGEKPKPTGDKLVLTYLRRAFDAPVPADVLQLGEAATTTGVSPVDPNLFRQIAARLNGEPSLTHRKEWLVSVALPIEAGNPAEAVRQFWSHVQEMGPAELPTYVWPSGDELAMQVFVLGEEANQDPEEEDEEPAEEDD